VAVHLAGLGVVGGGGGGMEDNADSLWKKHQLPAPQSPQVVLNGPPSKATSMMYGIPETDETRWSMNPIHCRTSFEPTVGGTLHDSIISGAVAEDIDLMFPKGPMIFNTGWTLDLGPTAKQKERYLIPYNFGYLYSTQAFYGVPASGTIKLFLPYEQNESVLTYDSEVEEMVEATNGTRRNTVKEDYPHPDSMQFLNIVVCGANENYGAKQCNMERDVEFIAGGEKIVDVHYIDAMGVSDRGKRICVTMSVPSNATLTTKQLMMAESDEGGKGRKATEKQSPTNKKSETRQLEVGTVADTLGLSLEISVTGKVIWVNGPCILSHVIWEQKRTDL